MRERPTIQNLRLTTITLMVLGSIYLGCAVRLEPIAIKDLGRQQTTERNYKPGETQIAAVGASMIRVKDYVVHRQATDVLRPSENFEVFAKWPLSKEFLGRFEADEPYKIAGVAQHQTKEYYILPLPGGKTWAWVNPVSGEIKRITQGDPNSFVPLDVDLSAYGFQVTPQGAKFARVTEESVDTTPGYTNYELIYSGNDGQSLFFSYREYSPEDMARTAFYQDLRYNIDTPRIRFRTLVIEVEEVGNEAIRFRVLADDD